MLRGVRYNNRVKTYALRSEVKKKKNYSRPPTSKFGFEPGKW